MTRWLIRIWRRFLFLKVFATRKQAQLFGVGSRWVRPVPAEWKGLPLKLSDPDGSDVPGELMQGGTEMRSVPAIPSLS